MRYCEILWTISPARGEWFNVVNVVAASMELQIDILPTYEAIPVLGFVQSIDERLSISDRDQRLSDLQTTGMSHNRDRN